MSIPKKEQYPVVNTTGYHPVAAKVEGYPLGWYHAIRLTIDRHAIGHVAGISDESRFEHEGVVIEIRESDLREMCEAILARLDDTESPIDRPRITYDGMSSHGR